MNKISLAIHGGAGTIDRNLITAEQESAYKSGLKIALQKGYGILENGGSALDAVMAAVVSLEDNDLFNAGKGSVFTHEGTHEMDASVMCGDLACGAVAGIKGVKNPVILARTIMEKSQHVLLAGNGAEEFARLNGLDFEPDDYFFSAFRYHQLKQIQETDQVALDHSLVKEKKFGTVGAVACDSKGNLAAATSTGGMTNKRFGRMGDTPLIGCGTYANNETCAVSCTGHGELFIKAVTAYDVSCLMEYRGMSLQEACEEVVLRKLVAIQGEGGLIAVDRKGNLSMVFNSDGMYRAQKIPDQELIAIYK